MVNEKFICTNSYISQTQLPSSDFVINPYVGCPHKCLYCYAEFMKRFTNHQEAWGDFIDIKICDKKINPKKLQGKKVIMSSVTDPYNPFEKKYEVTRKILEQLKDINFEFTILTKSDLILRDIDLLKEFKNLEVAFSVNSTDDEFRRKIEPFASSVVSRFDALQKLHLEGISTAVFVSPIFPGITDVKEIIRTAESYVDDFWFENLNLRGAYRYRIFEFIKKEYPDLIPLYDKIYKYKDSSYWENLEQEMLNCCDENGVNCKNYFYHEKIRKQKP